MATKQPKQAKQPKKNEKVFRSIGHFKKHFFPEAHAEEVLRKKMQDPERFGTGLAEEFLEGVRQALRRQ